MILEGFTSWIGLLTKLHKSSMTSRTQTGFYVFLLLQHQFFQTFQMSSLGLRCGEVCPTTVRSVFPTVLVVGGKQNYWALHSLEGGRSLGRSRWSWEAAVRSTKTWVLAYDCRHPGVSGQLHRQYDIEQSFMECFQLTLVAVLSFVFCHPTVSHGFERALCLFQCMDDSTGANDMSLMF